MSIHFKQVSLYRHNQLVLADIELTLTEQRIAVIGANGSGKSSLVRLINGLLIADKGEVRVNGLNPTKEAKKIREKVGFLFQNPEHQIIMPMVEEDIALVLKNQGINKVKRLQQVNEFMQQMGISHLRGRSSHQLSGGEKQLVALAGILIAQPDILVMDEPSTLLDLKHLNRLKKRLDSLPQQILMITHDMSLAAMCGRVIVLDEGRVVYDNIPDKAIEFYQQRMQAIS